MPAKVAARYFSSRPRGPRNGNARDALSEPKKARYPIPAGFTESEKATIAAWRADPRTDGNVFFSSISRLRDAAPEFEELATVQAGGGRLSVRRAKVEEAARPLRAEYVSGNYLSTFGVPSFAGRLSAARRPAAAICETLDHGAVH